jgi:hypothetical protein
MNEFHIFYPPGPMIELQIKQDLCLDANIIVLKFYFN